MSKVDGSLCPLHSARVVLVGRLFTVMSPSPSGFWISGIDVREGSAFVRDRDIFKSVQRYVRTYLHFLYRQDDIIFYK